MACKDNKTMNNFISIVFFTWIGQSCYPVSESTGETAK